MSSAIGAFKLGINLMLLDNFTNKFGNVETKLGKINKWADNFGNKISSVMTPRNFALVGIGTKIMKDFAETEDATIQLQNTMMGIGGVASRELEIRN